MTLSALLAIPSVMRDAVFSAEALAQIESLVNLRRSTDSDWSAATKDIEMLITGWGTPPLDEDVLSRMPRLRAVLHSAGSIRWLLPMKAIHDGLTVVSAADANNDAVAEFVYAQTVLALKGIHTAARHMRTTGRMPDPVTAPGSVRQTIGLVSFGSIARKVRERLRSLDSTVLVWDPLVTAEQAKAAQVDAVADLTDLFERSMLVSVHTPWIPGTTENTIRHDHLTLLPHRATLINTSRGPIIEEPALIDFLTDRQDVTAILDVTVDEPPAADSPLYTLPNVVLTGHMAGTVGTERLALGQLIADEVRRFVHGEEMHHRIDPERVAFLA